uniref:Uncharacterized protein n=1 Tax=Plectus sambesii TaxID=2011161 RepID=A0A914VAC6_9BILA
MRPRWGRLMRSAAAAHSYCWPLVYGSVLPLPPPLPPWPPWPIAGSGAGQLEHIFGPGPLCDESAPATVIIFGAGKRTGGSSPSGETLIKFRNDEASSRYRFRPTALAGVAEMAAGITGEFWQKLNSTEAADEGDPFDAIPLAPSNCTIKNKYDSCASALPFLRGRSRCYPEGRYLRCSRLGHSSKPTAATTDYARLLNETADLCGAAPAAGPIRATLRLPLSSTIRHQMNSDTSAERLFRWPPSPSSRWRPSIVSGVVDVVVLRSLARSLKPSSRMSEIEGKWGSGLSPPSATGRDRGRDELIGPDVAGAIVGSGPGGAVAP